MGAAIKLGEMRDARYEVDKAQIKLDAAKALLALLEARTAAAPVTVTTTAEAPTAAAAHTELEAFFDEIPVMPAAAEAEAEAEAKKTRDLREEPEIPYDAPGPEVPRNGRFLPAGAIAAANAAETFSALDAFFDSIPKMPSHEEAMQWGHDKHQRDLGHWARNWAAKDDAGRRERFESMRWILKDLKPDALQKFLMELPAKQLAECKRLQTAWDNTTFTTAFATAAAAVAPAPAETFSELDAFFDDIPKMPSHEEAMQWGHDKHQRDLGHWARNWAAKDDAGRKERFESMRRILKDLKPDALQKFLAELPAKQLAECKRLHQLTTWDLYWAEKDAATDAADN